VNLELNHGAVGDSSTKPRASQLASLFLKIIFQRPGGVAAPKFLSEITGNIHSKKSNTIYERSWPRYYNIVRRGKKVCLSFPIVICDEGSKVG
jgi:hypothetical protein